MAKEKMDVMMNDMRGCMSTNLDELVLWDGLTFHSTGDFLPPPCQVLNATGGNIRRFTVPIQSSRVVQNPYAPTGPAQGLGKLGLGLRPHLKTKISLKKKGPIFHS